jgi:prepilin-type N-terminal cleavage/methylation domain-containing protein
MDRVSRQSGLTLIELLIAMAVMSMLTVIASYAFSLFSRDWTVVGGGYERAEGQFRRFELMQRAILDSLPWVVVREDGSEGLYFLGRSDGLTLVTASPVFSPDSLAVIRLIVEKVSNGRSRLVYEEAPLKELILLRADQTLPFKFRMTIMESATDIVFRYRWLQAASADDPSGGDSVDPVLVWAAEFDGFKLVGQPVDVSLDVGGATTYFALPQRADTALGRVRGSL